MSKKERTFWIDSYFKQRDMFMPAFKLIGFDTPEYLIEPATCSHFACGKHLTPEEQLYGSRCIAHQQRIKIDINKHLNF